MLNTHQILIDIEWLKTAKEWDSDDRQELADWTHLVSNYEALQALQENPVILERIERMKDAVREIDRMLTSDKDLILNPDKRGEVAYLLAKKDVYQEELYLIGSDLETSVEEIAGIVSEKLSRLKGNKV